MENYKIKPDQLDKWKTAVGNNALDPYSFGVVLATCAAFEVLDNPDKTPKDAEAAWNGLGLSGFMAGCSAQWIAKYHERGDEFRQYFNAQWGVTEDKAKGGTVNPALWTT